VVAIKLRTEPVYNPITNLVYVGTNRYPFLHSLHHRSNGVTFSLCACAVVHVRVVSRTCGWPASSWSRTRR
jgi:hypothetical protein